MGHIAQLSSDSHYKISFFLGGGVIYKIYEQFSKIDPDTHWASFETGYFIVKLHMEHAKHFISKEDQEELFI